MRESLKDRHGSIILSVTQGSLNLPSHTGMMVSLSIVCYDARWPWKSSTAKRVFNLHSGNWSIQFNAVWREDLWGYAIFKQAKNYIKALRAQGWPHKQHKLVTIFKAAQDLCFISIAGSSNNHLSNAGIAKDLRITIWCNSHKCDYCVVMAFTNFPLIPSIVENRGNEDLQKNHILYTGAPKSEKLWERSQTT